MKRSPNMSSISPFPPLFIFSCCYAAEMFALKLPCAALYLTPASPSTYYPIRPLDYEERGLQQQTLFL